MTTCDCAECSAPATLVCGCEPCAGRLDPAYVIRACESHRSLVESLHVMIIGRGADWKPIERDT